LLHFSRRAPLAYTGFGLYLLPSDLSRQRGGDFLRRLLARRIGELYGVDAACAVDADDDSNVFGHGEGFLFLLFMS
jgi:hypothetical protein